MYDCRPESKDALSETDDRKGKSPTSEPSVDIAAALNAEHDVESAKDMQL